jgi:hypothetical protein
MVESPDFNAARLRTSYTTGSGASAALGSSPVADTGATEKPTFPYPDDMSCPFLHLLKDIPENNARNF